MIASLTSAFLRNIEQSPAIPDEATERAQVELAGGVAFVSDADLEAALEDAGVAAGDNGGDARRVWRRPPRRSAGGARDSRRALLIALFLAQTIPTRPIGVEERKE